MNEQARRVAARLAAEIGYKETGNNITKFARELDAVEKPRIPRQGSAWCGTFIDWGFHKEGLTGTLVFRNFGTSMASQAYQRAKRWTRMSPEFGDLGFRADKGPGHVGFVISVDTRRGKVTTLEGNTSFSFFGSQTSGGVVAERVRNLSWWAGGFGKPKYSAAVDDNFLRNIEAAIAIFRSQIYKFDDIGQGVLLIQERLDLQPREWGIDGVTPWFGTRTVEQVRTFQKFVGLSADGIVGPKTWAALFGEVG